jgi:hypothetical protein
MLSWLFGNRIKFYSKNEEAAKSKVYFHNLGISEADALKLHDVLIEIDGDIFDTAVTELLIFWKLDDTIFFRRVFNVFGKKNYNCVTYEEFVIALWSFCSLDNNAMTEYVFEMYDMDGSFRMDRQDTITLMKDTYGARLEDNAHAIKCV